MAQASRACQAELAGIGENSRENTDQIPNLTNEPTKLISLQALAPERLKARYPGGPLTALNAIPPRETII
jgi:hypothetical protein